MSQAPASSNTPAASYNASATTQSQSARANSRQIPMPVDDPNQPASSSPPLPPPAFPFQSTTTAPSPPPRASPRGEDLVNPTISAERGAHHPTTPLRISTDVNSNTTASPSQLDSTLSPPRTHPLRHKVSTGSLKALQRTPSLKAALANSIGTGSASSSRVPSPIISALGDMTPLPSPLLSGDSPGPWKKLISAAASSPTSSEKMAPVGDDSVLVTSTGESIDAAIANAVKRRAYASLEAGQIPPANASQLEPTRHSRNRSTSEYVPPAIGAAKRQVTVSGSHANIDSAESEESHIKREAHLADARGLTPSSGQPPTPPPSESSKDSVDGSTKARNASSEYFEARGRHDNKRRKWTALKCLGQGTFSRVMLATSQKISDDEVLNDPLSPVSANTIGAGIDRKTLVAVKVCEHGPMGGASEDRIEMSLKRELEIMQAIKHPSLVDLKAWSIEPTRAILVLTHCPGGDLFDLAATHRNLLEAPLLRRIFAELVGAVSYLHDQLIVHRDIKLENVLVNLLPQELADPSIDWLTYPYSVITLTDLGLSRRITADEKLETRCGSDDYAAPEVIMGQPYDGRAIDAWSMGVLLYALLEARLPFDPHPGMSDAHRMRSRTSHRIARVEWRWIEYAGEDTDHDGSEARFAERGLLGAMEITEGLLKRARSRWTLEKVAKHPWVRDAIHVEGGLHYREEDHGEELS